MVRANAHPACAQTAHVESMETLGTADVGSRFREVLISTVKRFGTVERPQNDDENAIARLAAVVVGQPEAGSTREHHWLARLERWHYVDSQGGSDSVRRDPALSQWVRNQRRSRTLNALQVALLSAFDRWDWEPRTAGWFRRLEEVERFQAAHGRSPRTRAHDVDERALALWVARQRRFLQRGQMSHRRVIAVRQTSTALRALFAPNPTSCVHERQDEDDGRRVELAARVAAVRAP